MLDTLGNDGFEAIRQEEMIALLDWDLRSGVARSPTRPVNTRSSLALAVHGTLQSRHESFIGSPSLNMLTGTAADKK